MTGTLLSMRRLLPVLIVVAAIPVVAACGSEDLPSVSAADAAQATRDAHTARMTMRMEMQGMGLPEGVTFSAEGVAATDAPRMDLTFDFGGLLEQLGAEGDGEARVLLDGRDAYVDPPKLEGVELPAGASWVALDLKQVAQAIGVDAEGLGELFHLSPEQQLVALEAAGSMEEVGEDEVDGVRTTHLRGTLTMRDYAQALPPDRRRELNKAIRQLSELAGEDPEWLNEPTPTDMWVDEDAHIRRMTQKSAIPAQKGVPAGAVSMTMEFDDFGTPLELDLPGEDDVYDATDDVARELRKAR